MKALETCWRALWLPLLWLGGGLYLLGVLISWGPSAARQQWDLLK